MQKALSLASLGRGHVSPNPLVGCVLVKNGTIVGMGAHKRFGGPHAEVLALQKAGKRARGATAYVTLEPCSHWGKTPPCALELAKAGVKTVFVALRDPNPKVAGKGISHLKNKKIKVHVGLEAEAATHLNKPFLTTMKRKRPYITLKMAMTLDGKTATSNLQSKWISSSPSRKFVHKLRSEVDAVLIGTQTALKDNPRLTSHGRGENPLRVVLDPHGRLKPSLGLFNDKKAKTLVVTTPKTSNRWALSLAKKGVQILRVSLKFGKFELTKILNYLSKIGVNHLLIEGGGETSWGFLKQKMVDEVLFFVAPKILGGRNAKTAVEGDGFSSITQALPLKSMSVARLGPDLLIKGQLTTL